MTSTDRTDHTPALPMGIPEIRAEIYCRSCGTPRFFHTVHAPGAAEKLVYCTTCGQPTAFVCRTCGVRYQHS
jgi:hypothetical protein